MSLFLIDYYGEIMRLFKNPKSIILSVSAFCVLFFTGGGFLCSSSKIKWDISECQSYQLKIRTETRNTGTKIGLTDSSVIEIEGVLNYRYFDTKNSSTRIGFQLSPVKCRVNGSEHFILSDFYSLPFYAEFASNGDILKIYTENISKNDSEMIEALMNPLKLFSKTAFWGRWSTIESDSNGLYSASYIKSFSETKKTRIKYIKYSNPGNDRIQVKILSSKNLFKQDSNCSWFKSFQSKENIFYSDMESNITGTVTYEMNYLSDNLSKTSILNNFKDFDTAFQVLKNNRRNNYSIKDRIRINESKEQLQKESIRSIISKFESRKSSQIQFERELADYLIINPDEAVKIYDMIASSSYPQNIAYSLLSAASLASTKQSQKVLINTALNPVINFNNRLQAAVHIGELQRIDMETVKAIETGSQNYNDQSNSLLSSAMLCSIGRLYGRRSKDYPSEEFDEIYNIFSKKLDTVKSVTETCALIRAIANTEDSSFFSKINDLRKKSGKAIIKTASLETLARIDKEQAYDILIDSFKNDKNPSVISEAIRLLSTREENTDFTKDVVSRILIEKDSEVKNAMIDYFMTNGKNDPEVKESLLEVLKTETDPDLRIKLHKVIYSKTSK